MAATACFRKAPQLAPAKRLGQRAVRSVARPAAFLITVKMPKGVTQSFECPPDKYIMDAAEAAGVPLPQSCRAGTCCTCAVKIESGVADRSEINFLDENQLDKGFMLCCSAYPKSDMVLITHQEENLWT